MHTFFLGKLIGRLYAVTKIIAVNRKYFVLVVSVVVFCFFVLGGFSIWQNTHASSARIETLPELKMIGVSVEPASFVKDLTYGSVTLKNAQVISTKTFDLILTVKNMTDKKMTDIPVELQMKLADNDSKKVTSTGNLASLEPGGTARIAFRQINALGDALGKNFTVGQHLITLRIKPNPVGGLEQASEASFRFLVDSSVKQPVSQKKH